MKYQNIKNVMPTTLCMKVWNELRGGKWYYGAVSKNGARAHWNRQFGIEKLERVGEEDRDYENLSQFPILSGKLEIDNEVVRKAWEYIKPKYFEEDDILSRCYANASTPGIDHMVHQDSPNNGAKTLIVYVNPEWQIDWGGETILYEPEKAEIFHSQPVNFNTGLLFNGYYWHGVRSITQYSKDVRITLMFKTEKPEFIKE